MYGRHVNVDRIVSEALSFHCILMIIGNGRGWLLGLLIASMPYTARAEHRGDAYGRLATETTLTLGLGGGAQVIEPQSLSVIGDVRLRYLESVGLVFSPELRSSGIAAFHLAVELRPLFWWRFLTAKQSGTHRVDLWLDSIGIELGTSYLTESSDSKPGFMLGAGFDLPLFGRVHPEVIFLHVGVRYVHSLESDYGGAPQGFRDLTTYVTLNSTWQL